MHCLSSLAVCAMIARSTGQIPRRAALRACASSESSLRCVPFMKRRPCSCLPTQLVDPHSGSLICDLQHEDQLNKVPRMEY